MKSKTVVNVKTTSVRMFDPQTSKIIVYKSTSQMTIPEAKELCKARNMTFIDKTNETDSFSIANTILINMKETNGS